MQQEKEKCESDRFVNVDQFMAGQLDKEVYQRRRADLGRLAEKLAADIAELEQKLKDAETMKDDNLSQALSVIKKYSGAGNGAGTDCEGCCHGSRACGDCLEVQG